MTPALQYSGWCRLPTPWAVFRFHAFLETLTGKEHAALTLGAVDDEAPVLTRVHSECLTGEVLTSLRCDCGAQLQAALERIATAGRGLLVYLRQEGRGIGLLNKVRAYRLQDEGLDTVEANLRLGFTADERHYDVCKPMLAYLGVSRLVLLTNNPRKIAALQQLGLVITERWPIVVGKNTVNAKYLDTKADRLGHLFSPIHTDCD